MESTNILFAISTLPMFFSGYSCRRGYMAGILGSALVAQIPMYINISTIGLSEYVQKTVSAPAHSWIAAMAYVIFIWVVGYVCGGIGIKKKGSTDDLPGQDVKSKGFELD